MAFRENPYSTLFHREIQKKTTISCQRSLQVTSDFVRRIGLEKELKGHVGCVNCLEWNSRGTLLASGSDDVQVIIWDPILGKEETSIRSGHTGNIFSVKFLPSSNDGIVVTGAADCKIKVHDVKTSDTTQTFGCHAGRVKRIATAPDVPFMFWSAAEDGTIMQFDLRAPETTNPTNPKNVLINLNAHIGSTAEAKCLSINPVKPELMAVGANDPYVRMYDRRMLTCKSVKFPTDSTARLPWERPHLEPEPVEGEDYSLPQGCVQYYIAGHLPQKQEEYKKKYRTLASTYVTFSQDGAELLVNLGGEQIYLFDINGANKPYRYQIPASVNANDSSTSFSSGSNGLHHPNGTTNGVTSHTNGVSKHFVKQDAEGSVGKSRTKSKYHGKPLHPTVEAIKQHANAVFEKQDYTQAILLYNRAVSMAPSSPVLFGNRAAAYMKRNWDGDLYAALRDCHQAIQLDPEHLKAHFRLAKCLFELAWRPEALECLNVFKAKFPEYAKSQACSHLDRDIKAAIYSKTDQDDKESDRNQKSNKRKEVEISEQEKKWRVEGKDYEKRFCGHCNTTTDIKEANFFGTNGQFIVAGSDDGSFFVWEKQTTNIMRVLRGDDSIVNCLQPHPNYCMLATSGIDPVVRLWTPRPEDGQKDEREVDNSDDAAAANQKRMNADPLEVMLMNMGYSRIAGILDNEDEEYRDGEGHTPCRPS